MDIRLMLSENEIEMIVRALDSYDTGLTTYDHELIEKIKIYLEKKMENAN